jgi:hypothetical protein
VLEVGGPNSPSTVGARRDTVASDVKASRGYADAGPMRWDRVKAWQAPIALAAGVAALIAAFLFNAP